jgi:hypothetical protein
MDDSYLVKPPQVVKFPLTFFNRRRLTRQGGAYEKD